MLNGSLNIDGEYEGDLLEVDTLMIGQSGRVKSNIKANNLIIEGIVIGNLESSVRILLRPTSRILGDIKTPELIIQNGVIFQGKCQITNNKNTSANSLIKRLYDNK